MAKSGPKGWRGEDRLKKWALSNGWPAERVEKTSRDQKGRHDVEIDFFGHRVLAESKNDKQIPGKRTRDAIAQSESYCTADDIPLLFFHLHGTSQDIVAFEKRHFERLVRIAYAAGQRAGNGVTFTPAAPVASVQADGLAHRID